MSIPRRRRPRNAGFTIAEVVIAMFLISMMCLSVFAGLQQITKTAISVAVRDEAYHLMQAKAEQLLSGTYVNFIPTAADETLNSSVKTSYTPSRVASLTSLSTDGAGRVAFKRRAVLVATTATTTTLRVEVEWTWQSRPEKITTLLYRDSSN